MKLFQVFQGIFLSIQQTVAAFLCNIPYIEYRYWDFFLEKYFYKCSNNPDCLRVLFLFLTAATLPSSSLWTIFLFLPPSAEDFQLSGSFRVKKPENLLVKRSRAQVKIDEFRFCHVAGANFDIFPPIFVRFSKKRIGK